MHAWKPGDARRQRLRDELVAELLPLARRIAGRYRNRGVPSEDLEQVAAIGLLNAIDRFDPAHGSGFLPFAVPTIRGTVRRYFRDHTWAIRAPRGLMELGARLEAARETLSARLGRAPRPSELAEFLDVDVEDVLQALQAAEGYTATSLDRPTNLDGIDGDTVADRIGDLDHDLELVADYQALRGVLPELDERARTIIMLRFFGEKTQSQIGEQIGCSQMHVSRLLSETLSYLRHRIEDADSDTDTDTDVGDRPRPAPPRRTTSRLV